MTIAGITIVNGSDSISVYAPVFRALDAQVTATTVAVLMLGVALWCALGSWLGTHQRVASAAAVGTSKVRATGAELMCVPVFV